MRTRCCLSLVLFVVATMIAWEFTLPASAVAAESKSLPRSVVIATHAVGSGFHADGSAVAKVVSERSPITMVVRPHPGPPAWLPAMNNGEIEFGVLVGSDGATAYKGTGAHRKAYPNIRLLITGSPLHVAFFAPVDSPIKATADLRGKRVPSSWAGLPIIHYTAGANLANGGLTWDDVVKVPIAELAENLRVFLEGRTDVFWHSVGAPAVQEANARIRGGVRIIPIAISPESLKRMAEFNPGTFMMSLKKGSAVGILADTPVQTEDEYLLAPAQLPEEVAYAVLKVLWDNNEELRKVTPRMQAWTRERMTSSEAAVPYHPAAVKFFREKGVWSEQMDALQQRLLTR